MASNEADHKILNDPVKSDFFFLFFLLKYFENHKATFHFLFVAACWGRKSAFFCFQ